MVDMEKVSKGLECLITDGVPCNGCPYCGSGYCIKNIASDAFDLLKEQQEQIDRLLEESASNAEMAEGYAELLKEQEAEIRQLRLALDIVKGTCKGIAFETDEKFMGDL